MAEILGLGCTHRPVMLRRNEDWTGMMRTSLDDPDMPAEMKDPARWPAELREELGNDFGRRGGGAGARGLSPALCRGAAQHSTTSNPTSSSCSATTSTKTSRRTSSRRSRCWPMTGMRSSRGRTGPGTPGASRMTGISASPATVPPANTWHRGCSSTASTQPMPTSRCITLWAMPSPTRCCCSTTSGAGSATRSCRSR